MIKRPAKSITSIKRDKIADNSNETNASPAIQKDEQDSSDN